MNKCILCFGKVNIQSPIIIDPKIFHKELDTLEGLWRMLGEFHERYQACMILGRDR